MHLYKNLQSNTPVERIHQVIYNMFVTKYIDNKKYDCIDPWGCTIDSFSWAIRSLYYFNLDYNNQGPYIITEVFINGTGRVHRGSINKK